jgi:hypothetical protein
MRSLLAVPVLLMAAATSLLSADVPPPAGTVRGGSAAIAERLARIERILWERDAGAVPTLREWAARDDSDRVRERSVGALVTLRDTRDPRVYFERLASDPSPRVRRAAADAIGTLGIPVDRPDRLSTPLRKDPDPMVRAECARAIGKTGDRRAFTFLLIALVQDPSPEVRALSAESLMRLRVVESVDVLKSTARNDRSLLVRVYAIRALAGIAPNGSADLFQAIWEQAAEPELRLEAFEGLLQTTWAKDWIGAGLKDSDPKIRSRASRVEGSR